MALLSPVVGLWIFPDALADVHHSHAHAHLLLPKPFVWLCKPSWLCAQMQMGIYYFLSPRCTRSIRYGQAPRNRLDLHRPPSSLKSPPEGYPVVIYLTGAQEP